MQGKYILAITFPANVTCQLWFSCGNVLIEASFVVAGAVIPFVPSNPVMFDQFKEFGNCGSSV